MQSFLVFGLSASLAAMGELAGHERRGSLMWPTRSALIGLMGAALGIRRDGDFSALDSLDISVAIFDWGVPLRDFHTVQSVPSAAIKSPNSRPEALQALRPGDNPSITLRDYRSSVLFGIAVTGQGLDRIADALIEPSFTLYLGRKSCPLCAPTGPKVVSAPDAETALQHIILPPWRAGAVAHTLVQTAPEGELVNDLAIDRAHWHFGPRRVAMRRVAIVNAGTT